MKSRFTSILTVSIFFKTKTKFYPSLVKKNNNKVLVEFIRTWSVACRPTLIINCVLWSPGKSFTRPSQIIVSSKRMSCSPLIAQLRGFINSSASRSGICKITILVRVGFAFVTPHLTWLAKIFEFASVKCGRKISTLLQNYCCQCKTYSYTLQVCVPFKQFCNGVCDTVPVYFQHRLFVLKRTFLSVIYFKVCSIHTHGAPRWI